jgi:deoxyhypusine synthase
MTSATGGPPSGAAEAVLKQSEVLPSATPIIRGYDFSNGVDYEALLRSMATTGFQASNLGQAIDEINRMVSAQGCNVAA